LLDAIILLTGPAEQFALAAALRRHRPDLDLVPAATPEALAAIGDDVLVRARLLGFATAVIVPPRVLDLLGYGACNFHPGPPSYPGFSPAQFAVYDRASRFGATAHFMVPRVDEGAIFDVGLFDVPPGTGVADLEWRSFRELALLFWRNAERLACDEDLPAPLPLAWSGEKSSRRKYRALCELPPDIGEDELGRRLAAFGGGYFGIRPAVTLHGARFVLASPEIGAISAAASPQIPERIEAA
jgi:hypothetical protein